MCIEEEEKNYRKIPTWNVSFFFARCWFCVSSCYVYFALLWFPCMSNTHEVRFHSLTNPKHTHVRTHTLMCGILEPSFFVASMTLTRITKKRRPKRKACQGYMWNISRSPFNDAQTNQLTVNVLRWIVKFVLNLPQVLRISNTSWQWWRW